MEKTYDPKIIEQHWYQTWEKAGYFAPRARETLLHHVTATQCDWQFAYGPWLSTSP